MTGRSVAAACLLVFVTGCAATPPPDLTAFRAHEPRSILVLPPLNETVDVHADYNWLSTVTMPLAEHGYYVFPVAVVDAYMKDNGLPTPGEMHGVPPERLGKVFGADAVLYMTITEWGQKYVIVSSNTVVAARAQLVDAVTGTVLWEGSVRLVEQSGGSGDALVDLVAAVVEQIVDSKSDQAHPLARKASHALFLNPEIGLPPGRRSPDYATDLRGR